MKNNARFPRAIATGLTLAAVLAVGILIWGNGAETAGGQEPMVVGFDMNTAGNECPADGTDCSVGPIDNCVSLNPGDSLQFDVFLQGLPEGEDFAGSDFSIQWGPPDWLDVTERIHTSASVNLLVQISGSAPVDLSPQELPVTSSPHTASIIDFALPVGRNDETNPPYTQGVLGRYTGQVAADTTLGLYALTFDLNFLSIYNSTPQNLCDIYDCDVWDGNHAPQYGLVAVGQECPAGPTTPEPGAEASPAATAAPTETTAAASTASPAITSTPARATTATPGPAGASTPAAASSDDDDGTDWGSPVLIVVYVVAGFVGGLAVAGIAYLGTRGRRA
jgi:hypothetical protein